MIRKGLTNRLRVRVFAPALGALVTLGIICTNRIPATKADDGRRLHTLVCVICNERFLRFFTPARNPCNKACLTFMRPPNADE